MKTTKICYILFALLLAACHNDEDADLQKSSSKQITGFVFKAADNEAFDTDIIAAIDQNGKTITAKVPHDIDVTALVPGIDVSEKASVSPVGAANFKYPVSYTVTAEDRSTDVYEATVAIAPSNEKQILNFRFEGIESEGVTVAISADIKVDAKTIMAIMPSGTDITSLEPVVEISPGASLEPEGPQDFTEPINYTVTAEDGSSSTYLVTAKLALTEKEILLLIAMENPGNTLVGWTEENSLEDFEGISLENGNVKGLKARSKALTVLPPEIGQLRHLTSLNLGENGLIALPPQIGQLVNLKDLYLFQNQLTSIPAEIGQLENLEILHLALNLINMVPPEIRKLSSLSELHLEFNDLASIPSEIGQLVNLNTFFVAGNSLTSVPSAIGQLNNLKYLILSYNLLTSLPSEIGQLENLMELQVHANMLTSIPKEIGQLSNLEGLYLYDNILTSIPVEIGQLKSLILLHLSLNALSSIPTEVEQLQRLKKLFLKDNLFAAVPSEIGQLTQLEVLQLGGNGLTEIPKAVCDLDTTRGGTTEVDIVPGVKCLGDRTSSYQQTLKL
jgi:Leucine-rich repeat (LRR) protein